MRKKKIPPSFEEVKAYCRERKNKVDAQRFFDYYTANGWKVGRNQMKDWQAAVRTWEHSNGGEAKKTYNSSDLNNQFADLSDDDL